MIFAIPKPPTGQIRLTVTLQTIMSITGGIVVTAPLTLIVVAVMNGHLIIQLAIKSISLVQKHHGKLEIRHVEALPSVLGNHNHAQHLIAALHPSPI